jgi:hypothetical protein
MAVGTVRYVDYLINTAYAQNITGLIGAANVQDGAESAASIILSPNGVRTANYTAFITDRGTVVPMNTTSGTTTANATFTIPPFNSVPFPNGALLGLCWVSTGTIQPAFAAGAGVTLYPASPLTVRAAGSVGWVWQYSQNVWYLMGDIG